MLWPIVLPFKITFWLLAAIVLLVTMELTRARTDWSSTAITLWWGSAALILVVWGLLRRARYLRYIAWGLFALTLGKAFLVDMSDLDGLNRIAAFMGLGVLLLVVSFFYHRLIAVFENPDSEGGE